MELSTPKFLNLKAYDFDCPSPDPFNTNFSSSLFFDMDPFDDTIVCKAEPISPRAETPSDSFDDISNLVGSTSAPLKTPTATNLSSSLVREIITLPKIIFYETKKSHILQIFRHKLDRELDEYFAQIVNAQQKIVVTVHNTQNSQLVDKMLFIDSILTFDSADDCYQCNLDVLTTSSRNKRLYATITISGIVYISNEFKIQNHPPRKRKIGEAMPNDLISLFVYTSLDSPPLEMSFQMNNLDLIKTNVLKKLKSNNKIRAHKNEKDFVFCFYHPELNDWALLTELEQIASGPRKILIRSRTEDSAIGLNLPSMATIAMRIYRAEMSIELMRKIATKFKPHLMKHSDGLLWFSFSTRENTLTCLTCYSTPEQAQKSMSIAQNWLRSSETSEFNVDVNKGLKLLSYDCVPFTTIDRTQL